ncbi:MAG TPA: hypothetical protein VGE05_15540 [Novosphingobium sp.]
MPYTKNILGKGEAESSNLSSSTINLPDSQAFEGSPSPFSPATVGRTKQDFPKQNGEIPGVTFAQRSDDDKQKLAAEWLATHREHCVARIIPTLRANFGLTNRQAIEAAQMAHALQYGGV